MKKITITDAIHYIGVDDKTLDLFEAQYPVPDGISYNSYVILDEKIAVMDTVDARASESWLEQLTQALAGRAADYLVVSHMEPDHGANVKKLAELYPSAKIVGSAKTFRMINQFFDMELADDRKVVVKEADTLVLGEHVLQFFMAPMIHWPEVMMTYEQKEKILFSADGFGKFGALDVENPEADWEEEAARYYLNIVGKYGAQVQALLKKTASLDIRMICPLHGPVLKENLEYYIGKYQTWSSYEPETHGVLVAYASVHGNTRTAAANFAELLKGQGNQVELMDLSRTDMSLAVRKAFYYDRMVVAATTYDGGLFPSMEEFLLHIRSKNYQKRTVGIIENGSWAPAAGKAMRGILETMKDVVILEPVVTIKSAVNVNSYGVMIQLAGAITSAAAR